MDKGQEALKLLNEVYDLEDSNKEELNKIQVLQRKINGHKGMMSLRSKKINILNEKVREVIRGKWGSYV